MISKECLCSQGGLFIASDTEGFKYRVNITINTNSNGLYRKENYKVLAFFFLGHHWFFFLTAGSSPSDFFSFKRNHGPTSLKQYRHCFSEPCGYPDYCFMDVNSSSSTLLSPYLFRLHLPHPAVFPGALWKILY